MIKFSRHPLLAVCIIIISFPLIFPSCEFLRKDTDYIGTWQSTRKITTDDLVYNTTRTISFTRSTYEESYVIQRENSASISSIIGTRGDLSASHSSLTFLLEELGTCEKDAYEKCTGSIQWFGQGTPYWTDNIIYFKVTVKGEFEADETTLRLKRDLNDDGDSDDAGEDVEFMKL